MKACFIYSILLLLNVPVYIYGHARMATSDIEIYDMSSPALPVRPNNNKSGWPAIKTKESHPIMRLWSSVIYQNYYEILELLRNTGTTKTMIYYAVIFLPIKPTPFTGIVPKAKKPLKGVHRNTGTH